MALASSLVVLALAALWVGMGHQSTEQPRPQSQGDAQSVPGEPLEATYFRQHPAGKALLAFLLCTDFDCPQALERIEELGAQAVEPLLQLLASGLPQGLAPAAVPRLTRRRVLIALGRLGDARAVPALLATLDDADPLLRAAAVEALGQCGDPATLPHLLPRLRDPDPLVRETTATALGRLGEPKAIPALRDAAAREEHEHVRRSIAAAIAAIEHR